MKEEKNPPSAGIFSRRAFISPILIAWGPFKFSIHISFNHQPQWLANEDLKMARDLHPILLTLCLQDTPAAPPRLDIPSHIRTSRRSKACNSYDLSTLFSVSIRVLITEQWVELARGWSLFRLSPARWVAGCFILDLLLPPEINVLLLNWKLLSKAGIMWFKESKNNT